MCSPCSSYGGCGPLGWSSALSGVRDVGQQSGYGGKERASVVTMAISRQLEVGSGFYFPLLLFLSLSSREDSHCCDGNVCLFPAVSEHPAPEEDRTATGSAAAHLALRAALRREIRTLPAASEARRPHGR